MNKQELFERITKSLGIYQMEVCQLGDKLIGNYKGFRFEIIITGESSIQLEDKNE